MRPTMGLLASLHLAYRTSLWINLLAVEQRQNYDKPHPHCTESLKHNDW